MPKKSFKSNRLLVSFLRHTLCRLLQRLFNVVFVDENGVHELVPPYFIFANHTNFWDPFFLSTYIPEPVYFVTSEFFFRNRILNFLLGLVGAIPKTKSMSDSETIRSILRVRNDNRIIGIFPEGHRCWDGVSLPLMYPTAKLVKSLKIPVVVSLMKGAYMSLPRWAKTRRKGRIAITYKLVLTTEEIAGMTADEIYQCLTEHLYLDETASQKSNPVSFRGRKLAEHLELFLYACPSCEAIGSLKSRNDLLFCRECGYTVRYDTYGFFNKVTGDVFYSTPREWGVWQVGLLKRLVLEHAGEYVQKPLLEDRFVILKTGNRGIPLKTLSPGRLSLYNDRLEFRGLGGRNYSFGIDKIMGINVQSNNLFEFYSEKVLYSFHFGIENTSPLKWVEAVQVLKNSSHFRDLKV